MLSNLSIVTVTYNNEEGLNKTLSSILSLKNLPSEVIVIDGKSSDNTSEIILRFKNCLNIKYISERDKGIYDAMNKGIELVRTEYMLFLNAGDLIEPDALPDEISFAGFINYRTYTFDNKEIKNRINSFRYSIPVVHQAIVFPKTEIRYDLKYSIASDFDFYLKNRNLIISKFYPAQGCVNYERGGVSDKKYVQLIYERFNIVLIHFGLLFSLRNLLIDIPKLVFKYFFYNYYTKPQ